jgi:hypothetical protein
MWTAERGGFQAVRKTPIIRDGSGDLWEARLLFDWNIEARLLYDWNIGAFDEHSWNDHVENFR